MYVFVWILFKFTVVMFSIYNVLLKVEQWGRHDNTIFFLYWPCVGDERQI